MRPGATLVKKKKCKLTSWAADAAAARFCRPRPRPIEFPSGHWRSGDRFEAGGCRMALAWVVVRAVGLQLSACLKAESDSLALVASEESRYCRTLFPSTEAQLCSASKRAVSRSISVAP